MHGEEKKIKTKQQNLSGKMGVGTEPHRGEKGEREAIKSLFKLPNPPPAGHSAASMLPGGRRPSRGSAPAGAADKSRWRWRCGGLLTTAAAAAAVGAAGRPAAAPSFPPGRVRGSVRRRACMYVGMYVCGCGCAPVGAGVSVCVCERACLCVCVSVCAGPHTRAAAAA